MDQKFLSDGISIIIPTYNSSIFLANLLKTVISSSLLSSVIEVIIVDDSSESEAKAIQSLCTQYSARYLWCKGNVAKKRNFGITNSSQSVVLFTDSDCELTQSTISEHLNLMKARQEIGAMLGVVEFIGPDNWVWSVIERTSFLGAFSFARRMKYAPWGVTANLSVKRTVLEEVNGFDETFLSTPGGEDVELGIRINQAGYKITCNPNAVVYHTRKTWNTLGSMFRRVFSYGRAHYHVIMKHLDQVGYEYPRIASIILITFFIQLVKATITMQWLLLVDFLIFLLVVFIVQASLVLRLEKRNLKEIPREILAHGLDSLFEVGLILESLYHCDLRGFWAKMIYAERQLIFERPRKIIQTWSILAGFLFLLILL